MEPRAGVGTADEAAVAAAPLSQNCSAQAELPGTQTAVPKQAAERYGLLRTAIAWRPTRCPANACLPAAASLEEARWAEQLLAVAKTKMDLPALAGARGWRAARLSCSAWA